MDDLQRLEDWVTPLLAKLSGPEQRALARTVARELFGDADPIDQTVRVRKVPMQVVGVLSRKGQNSWGQDQDDVILVPLSTYRNRIEGMSAGRIKRVGAISVKVRDGQSMSDAGDKIGVLLRQRHRLPAGAALALISAAARL